MPSHSKGWPVSEWNQFRGDERNTGRIGRDLSGPQAKPAETWATELRGPVRCPPVVDHDTIYVGTTDGHLYALDFQGRRRWVYETTASTTLAPAVGGHRVVCCLADTVVALDAPTGALEWERPVEGLYTTPPTLDGGLLLVGNSDGLVALRAETGEAIWTATLEGTAVSAPAVDEDQVYVATQNEQVHALALGSGESVWSAPTDGTVVGGPTLADERAYVADTDGTLLALGVEDGRTWFTYEIRGGFTSAPTVLEGDDTLFVAADDDTLHVTDTTFGNRKLRGLLFSKAGLPLDGTPTTDPILVGDVVIVGDETGGLYGVDASDPDFRWHLPLESGVEGTPAPVLTRGSRATTADDGVTHAAVETGQLFVGTEDGRLRCLEWETPP